MTTLYIKKMYDSLENEFYNIQLENEIYDKTFIITFNFETINQVIISNTFGNINGDTFTNRLFVMDAETYIENKESIMEFLFTHYNELKRGTIQDIDIEELQYLYAEYIGGKAGDYELDSSLNFIFRINKVYSDSSFLIFQAPSLFILNNRGILYSLYNNTFEINDFFTYR